jgi:hypothetical protein
MPMRLDRTMTKSRTGNLDAMKYYRALMPGTRRYSTCQRG